MTAGLRERRKQQTRQAISDIATEMFLASGFDAVTISQVAEAAGVAKMTVTNYFPRKEDLVFDRADAIIRGLADTAAGRRPGGPGRTSRLSAGCGGLAKGSSAETPGRGDMRPLRFTGVSVRPWGVGRRRRGFSSITFAFRGSRGLGPGFGSGHVALAVEEASGINEEAGRVN